MKRESTTVTKNSANSKADKAIGMLLQCLIAVLPLIFFKQLNEIFEFPKITFFYLISSVIIFIHFFDVINKGLFLFQFNKMSRALFVFLGFYAVSSVFSFAKYTSFFGYYTRFNGGLLSLICFTLLYVVITSRKLDKNRLVETALFATVPICIYGIAQHFGFEKGHWVEDSQARIFSTLGQPNWLAAYLSMLFFAACFKAFFEKGVRKVAFSLLTIAIFATLFFTYSLSGLLGVFLASLLFAFSKRRLLQKNFKQAFLISIIISMIVITNPGILKPKITDAIKDIKTNLKITLVNKAQASENEASTPSTDKRAFGDTTGIRLIVWKGALTLITGSLQNFLIGTGPETFPYSFLKFRPISLNYTTEWDFIFNKPHNYYLELFANVGALGLIFYLMFIKELLLTKDAIGGLREGIVALLISDFFGWHTVSVSFLLILFAAMLSEKTALVEKKFFYSSYQKVAGLFAVTFLCALLFVVTCRFFLADYYNTSARSNLNNLKIKKAFELSQNAVALNPYEPNYRRTLATIYLTATLPDGLKTEEIKNYKELTLKQLNKAYDLQPFNLVNVKNLIPLYKFVAVIDVSDESKGFDAPFARSVVARYTDFENLSPTDASLALELAKNVSVFDKARSRKYYGRALELKTNLREAEEALKII